MAGGKAVSLYVWENVLCDWTCGMVVALARSEEEARDAVKKVNPQAAEQLFDPAFRPQGEIARPTTVLPISDGMPAAAWVVQGGG